MEDGWYESGTVMVKDIFPGGDGYGNVNEWRVVLSDRF